ncbi:MAG TPA: FadR/GntR family transcriptional regulator [Mycobacterium sp.]
MALQPVTRRSVPEQVFEQIAADVLAGELQPGESLPSERRLAELFEVSRPAVREALNRLSAAGLIEVRQGGGTTVRDFRRYGGPNLLPQLLFRNGKFDPAVARSLLEVRLRCGPKVAELAAARRSPELAELLAESLRALESESDPIEWQRRALTFWDHVFDGAASIVFQLMYNAFRAAYEQVLPLLPHSVAAEIRQLDDYRKLANAIRAGDTLTAKKTAHDLIEFANATLIETLDKLASR